MNADEHPFVALAREAIRHHLRDGAIPRLDSAPDDPPPTGVFVSLHEPASGGEGPLRGCIGSIEPRERSVRMEIARSAVAAAFSDPRFPPLTASEVDQLDITVYLLGTPEPVTDESALDPMEYGVIVEGQGRRGLLLPAIPSITTAEAQLAIALQKARLTARDDYRVYRFQATTYS